MPKRSARLGTRSSTSTSELPSAVRPASATGPVGPAASLAERLGLPVRDLELLEQALVHSSWLHEHRDAARGHNERLEFLGDVVVNMAISEALYEAHPSDDEGLLSTRRASIVSTTGLARLAGRIDLGALILLGEGEAQRGGRRRPLSSWRSPNSRTTAPACRSRARRAGSRSTPSVAPACGRSTGSSPQAGPTTRSSSGSRSGSTAARSGWGRGHRAGPPRRRRRLGPSRSSGASGRPRAPPRQPRARRQPPRAPRTWRSMRSPRYSRSRLRRERPARRPDGLRVDGAGAAPCPSAPGLQVVRRAHRRRVRWRYQRRRRTERIGQEQPRRRPPLVARRAGSGAPQPEVGGRHLRRLRQASRSRHGRRDARPRQCRRSPAGRILGPRARPTALPQRRERLSAQQAACPAARPRRPARRRAPRRQRIPLHRPGHGRSGTSPSPRGAPPAVRGGRRRPSP